MVLKLLNHYKIPLLIALVICAAVIGIPVVKDPFVIGLIIVGALAGAAFLDLDYFIYAYFTDTDRDFSKTFRAFVSHRDFDNALNYLNIHKSSIEDKVLNSALFQLALAGSSLIVVSAKAHLFVVALVLTAFLTSIYKMYEMYYKDQVYDWFWAIRVNVNKKFMILYSVALLGILAFSLYQLIFY